MSLNRRCGSCGQVVKLEFTGQPPNVYSVTMHYPLVFMRRRGFWQYGNAPCVGSYMPQAVIKKLIETG